MYLLNATNMELSQRKRNTQPPAPNIKSKEGDSISIIGLIADVWDLSMQAIIELYLSLERLKLVDSKDKAKIVHISNLKYVLPTEKVITKLPDYQSFGWRSRLRLDPHIPNLKWEPTLTVNTSFLAVTSKTAPCLLQPA